MSEEREYTVEGMTCDHCRRAVTERVLAVPGVRRVDVDIASGRATVSGERVEDDAVAAAVEGAGYRVAAVGGARRATSAAPVAPVPTGPVRGSDRGGRKGDVEP